MYSLRSKKSDKRTKTNATPTILSRDFVARLYRVTKSQVWHGVSRNFSTVEQLLFRLEQRSILCNFVAKMRWTLIGQFLFMRQSCSVRHVTFAILSRDKVARQNRTIKLQVWHWSKDERIRDIPALQASLGFQAVLVVLWSHRLLFHLEKPLF